MEALSPLVRLRLSSHLPLVCQLVVASPAVACLRLASPFVAAQPPPHASILDPTSLFAILNPSSLLSPAGCHVASLCTASASRVVEVVARRAVAIIIDFVTRRAFAIIVVDSRCR
jgi:hypothetical protein